MKKIIVSLLLISLMPSCMGQDYFNSMLSKAKSGDRHAQHQIAHFYSVGTGTERNYAHAFTWLSLSTTKIDVNLRQNMIMEMFDNKDYADYLKGMYRFLEQDFDKAIEIFTQLENKGIAEASSMLAICYGHKDYEKCNYQKAVEKAQTVADKDALAQFYLANMCLRGRGLKKDTIMAMNYFQKASDNGMIGIDGLVGNLYFVGKYVGKDYAKAVSYYQQAEKKNMIGGSPARFYGICLARNLGVLEPDSKHSEKVAEMSDNYLLDFYELMDYFYNW